MSAVTPFLTAPLINALGWTLMHFLWQGCLMASLVGLGLHVMKGQDSRARYAICCLGMLLMLLMPVLTFARLNHAPIPSTEALSLFQKNQPSPKTQTTSIAQAQRSSQSLAQSWNLETQGALPWLVAIWGFGCLCMSLHLTGRWVWLQWLRRRPETQAAPDTEQLLLLRLCQSMGVGSNLRLMVCKQVPGPTLLGWFKPVILIPPAMLTGLTPLQLEQILAHELAHVLRHDYLINLLQSLVEVLFFFHPAVWWVSKQIRQEREQATDDLAVRCLGDALEYASALTALEALALQSATPQTQPRQPNQPCPSLGARGGNFMFRIHRLINPTALPTPFSPSLAPRAGLVMLLLLGAPLLLHAKQTQQDAAPKAAPTPIPQDLEALQEGTVRVRRYDKDTRDAKTGHIDLHARRVPIATLERAFKRLSEIPANPSKDYVEEELHAESQEKGSFWSFNFRACEPERVMAIIRGQAARSDDWRQKGWLFISRGNQFTPELALLPKGLNVDVWAPNAPVHQVLKALTELEKMPPTPGVPQYIRVKIQPGSGPQTSIDQEQMDPQELRKKLEAELAK